eukprot:CAMPEP_0206438822 /NCGR_PEP_ID=MMETSP0324_2-20121206/11860_1 /ASSEMBLY_ACC=CAM_ASM_000836 /TAXON_ID=2866 /ORGANISM="Crypthecodinium cohnii, Strain Seligo" /LENGTH=439 /DNA_ID=CAMNT_0053906357 /DNA_START=1 /DNA_END=1320 /DNA_ORIENTATION=+
MAEEELGLLESESPNAQALHCFSAVPEGPERELWAAPARSRSAAMVSVALLTSGAVIGLAGSLLGNRESNHMASRGVTRWDDAMQASEKKDSFLPDFPSQCGKMEEGVEYNVEGGWYLALDHIPDPEMCCSMCQGTSKCLSFTWVQDAGLDGCPSQCWLKGGEPKWTDKKSGVVSGLPPPRAPFPSSKELAALQAPPKEKKLGGSFFCFSLMVPGSYEEDLLKFQHEEKISIFGCDEWDVYTNRTIHIAPGLTTSLVPVDLTVTFGGDSYTALNSWIFIAVWKKVIDDGRHMTHDWVVKVDPDAVFFPERLRPIAEQYKGLGYINNCKYGLHGPIEVISGQALKVLEADYKASYDGKAPKQCVEKLHFGLWGEDFFLSRCLWQIHNITRETEGALMCEAHCDCPDWYWCDGDRVTYHPFKRTDMYRQCMANSIAAVSKA